MKKVKGIELMQMIAEGKIDKKTRLIFDEESYEFNGDDIIDDIYRSSIFTIYSIKEILNMNFEILENDTEEIKKIGTNTGNTLFTMECFVGSTEKALDWNFNILKDKINELVRAVNSLGGKNE